MEREQARLAKVQTDMSIEQLNVISGNYGGDESNTAIHRQITPLDLSMIENKA